MKKCCKCKIEKPFEEFNKDKSKKDGHRNSCKSCDKKYREENKEKTSKKKKLYREENKEKITKQKKEYYQKNKDKILQQKKQHYIENRDIILEQKKEYSKENQDKIVKYKKQHYIENKEYYLANRSKYRASKLQATPSWLTEEQLEEILNIYKFRQKISDETEVLHHVDHIVPLQGETVCGLHVPWNLQVIPASENLSKNNKFDERLLKMLDNDDLLE